MRPWRVPPASSGGPLLWPVVGGLGGSDRDSASAVDPGVDDAAAERSPRAKGRLRKARDRTVRSVRSRPAVSGQRAKRAVSVGPRPGAAHGAEFSGAADPGILSLGRLAGKALPNAGGALSHCPDVLPRWPSMGRGDCSNLSAG
eukprot:2139873-Pyramimonas_sp.AAC.4